MYIFDEDEHDTLATPELLPQTHLFYFIGILSSLYVSFFFYFYFDPF